MLLRSRTLRALCRNYVAIPSAELSRSRGFVSLDTLGLVREGQEVNEEHKTAQAKNISKGTTRARKWTARPWFAVL